MSDTKKKPTLRSAAWFGTQDKNGFMYRSWMKNQGIPDHEFQGKPIIGICNTWSELTPCNAHFRKLAEHVKRGVLEAGGFPVEFPVFSNGESNLRPTAMLTRNLASMDVEESIRGNPIDGVVLLVGCDKTTPGAADGRGQRATCPAIVVTGGPMLNGKHQRPGHRLRHRRSGSCSEQVKAGKITLHEFLCGRSGHVALGRHLQHHGHGVDHGLHGRSAGHLAAAQRRDSGGGRAPLRAGPHVRHAHRRDGQRRPEAVEDPDAREAFENAIRVNAAIGGSTNAVIHLKAIAGRIGVTARAGRLDRASAAARPPSSTCMPSGRYLMEEFYYAGGLPARDAPPGRRQAAAASGCAHRQRQVAVGELRGCADLQRRGDPHARQAADRGRRHLHAARQPGAARRGTQAVRRIAAPDAAPRPRRRVRETSTTTSAHRSIPTWMWTRTRSC